MICMCRNDWALVFMRDNLTLAGGFSALAFLPVPAKLMDWFTRRRELMTEYMGVPALKGFRLHDGSWLQYLTQRSSQRNGCWHIVTAAEWVGGPLLLLTLDIVLPLCLLILPLVSPFVFMSKMASLPDVENFHNWGFPRWLSFASVINQISHIY